MIRFLVVLDFALAGHLQSMDSMDNSTQKRTLREIAEHVGGQLCGDPDTTILGASTLSEAREGDISFLVNRKYTRQLETTRASALIVGREIPEARVPLLVVEDPYFAFSQVLVLLYGQRKHQVVGISPRAAIAPDAQIGEDCQIHDFATVASGVRIGRGCVVYPCAYIGEGVEIGDDTIIHANAVVYERCRIGRRVLIHANSTVGSDGFGFATHNGVHHKIPQIGGVIVEDDVEIGACSSIERGTLSDTVIGQGSKLGDLVTIGHGTRIGPHCLIVAQVGIAGSATLGHHCTLGGQVGVVGHIALGDHVTVAAQAGVINNVADGQIVAGAPAVDMNRARRAYAMIPYLPQIRQDIRDLQNQLEKIAAALEARPTDSAEPQDVE
jgi:UDP-3-O-[3-hydroxymyristoyl] glucosamine N-acyltransferase